MTNTLDKEQFIAVLPKSFKKTVNDALIDSVNDVLSSCGDTAAETYKENLISYTSVLMDGKFTIKGYIDAVRYVSFKLLGNTNISAYKKTFPDRYSKFIANGVNDRDIASYITSYNKNKLVNLIMAQTLVPSYVLNADLYQKALNVSAELMLDAKSEKVRCDAANNLMNQLKLPENQKIELTLGVKEDSVISELRETTSKLIAEQRKVIEVGNYSVKDIAHSDIVSNI